MNKQVVTYSLLAHIYDKGTLANNLEDIFVPIVKRGLAKMCSSGKFKGEDLSEIKSFVNDDSGLEMPNPILRRLLDKIEREINTQENLKVKFYADGSFIIRDFVFDEYQEDIQKKENEIELLNKIFTDFLAEEKIEKKDANVFAFIEENKFSLGKYINKKYPSNTEDKTIEARFVNFLRSVPALYKVLQSVYIGSIISTYLEFEPQPIKKDVELLLDTNFVISLLDLNTSESTYNCIKLLELAGKLGYRFTVLSITLKEIDQLLNIKINLFDSLFLSRLVDPEDIYNACNRRGLSKVDLERIRTKIPELLEEYNISIVPNVEKYERAAKFSTEYEKLKEIRNTTFAALHDATCIEYVKEKRKKNFYDFSKVTCWFVNNSSRRKSNGFSNGQQPVIIKAEDLLNMLWLSSPIVKNALGIKDIANIGLFRLVSSTLNDALPHGAIIKELEENIRKYAKEKINDDDVVFISKSIAKRTFTQIEELNDVAGKDEQEFVTRLQSIVTKQKQEEANRQQFIDTLVATFKSQTESLSNERKGIEKDRLRLDETIDANAELSAALKRQKKEILQLKNAPILEKRERYKRRKIVFWRTRSWAYLVISISIPIIAYYSILRIHGYNIEETKNFIQNLTSNIPLSVAIGILYLLIPGFIINGLSSKYNNYSSIAKYEERIKYPSQLNIIEEIQD